MCTQSKFKKTGTDWIKNVTLINRGILVTYGLWENLSSGKNERTRYEIQKINRRFIRRLEKKCNVHQKQRLERFIVTETDKSRNHCHMIVETPIHIPYYMMIKHIIGSLHETKGLGKMDIREVYEKQHLIDYLCKEWSPNKDPIEWENCYFKDRNNSF
jgi:hypothetical protein|tara:strand:+ start:337 stop:810 length:474 start_codon:yes stop_codon:yes gene_type:complete